MKMTIGAMFVAASLAVTSPALAQGTDPATDPTMTTMPADDRDEFPWGLLGLLGLAGLLGMKRRDDVHINRGTADARRP